MTVENTSVATEAGLLFSYYIVLSFWAAQGLGMSLLSRNVAGQTKKSVAVTMNFIAWAVGNAIGKLNFRPTPHVSVLIRSRTTSLPRMGCSALLHRFCDPHRMLYSAHPHVDRPEAHADEAQCEEE